MPTRNEFLKEFRGSYLGEISEHTTPDEFFQNQTLRPILKLQNDILLAVVQKQVHKYSKDFGNFSVDKKQKCIENIMQKDEKFRKLLIGIVIGLFTESELETYLSNTSNLNKRMVSMLIERVLSQLQVI